MIFSTFKIGTILKICLLKFGKLLTYCFLFELSGVNNDVSKNIGF